MEIFSTIAGLASIISLIITIITLSQVIQIKNTFIDKSTSKIKQNLRSKNIIDSKITQSGNDTYDKTEH